MKNFYTLLLVTFSVIAAHAQGFSGDTWTEAKKNKSARVVLTNVDLAKFSETIDGYGSGISFDIMNDFAAYVRNKYGIAITYDYQPVPIRPISNLSSMR